MTHLQKTVVAFGGAAVLAIIAACNTASTADTADALSADGSVISCGSLASLALPNVTITAAEAVEAGGFVPPMPPGRSLSAGQTQQYASLPAFCRVAATLTPSDDSDIKMEVWMPAQDWNGKLQAVGNGAFTGSLRYGVGGPWLQGSNVATPRHLPTRDTLVGARSSATSAPRR